MRIKRLSQWLVAAACVAIFAAAGILWLSGADDGAVLDAGTVNAMLQLLGAAAVFGLSGLILFGVRRNATGMDSGEETAGGTLMDPGAMLERIDMLEKMLEDHHHIDAASDQLDPGFLAELETADSESPSGTDPALAGEYTPVSGVRGLEPDPVSDPPPESATDIQDAPDESMER